MSEILTEKEAKLVAHWRTQVATLDRDICDGDAADILAIVDRLVTVVDRYEVAVTREARENLFSGEELAASVKLGEEICDYIERCRTGLQLEGAIRAGVDSMIRTKALPWLSQRPKIIAEHVAR